MLIVHDKSIVSISHNTGLLYGSVRSPHEPTHVPNEADQVVAVRTILVSGLLSGEETINCALVIVPVPTIVGAIKVMIGGNLTVFSE